MLRSLVSFGVGFVNPRTVLGLTNSDVNLKSMHQLYNVACTLNNGVLVYVIPVLEQVAKTCNALCLLLLCNNVYVTNIVLLY